MRYFKIIIILFSIGVIQAQDTTSNKIQIIEDGDKRSFFYAPLDISETFEKGKDTTLITYQDTTSSTPIIDQISGDTIGFDFVILTKDSLLIKTLSAKKQQRIFQRELKRRYSQVANSAERNRREINRVENKANRFVRLLDKQIEDPDRGLLVVSVNESAISFLKSIYKTEAELVGNVKNKEEIVKVAEALGLETNGSKATIAGRIWNFINQE